MCAQSDLHDISSDLHDISSYFMRSMRKYAPCTKSDNAAVYLLRIGYTPPWRFDTIGKPEGKAQRFPTMSKPPRESMTFKPPSDQHSCPTTYVM